MAKFASALFELFSDLRWAFRSVSRRRRAALAFFICLGPAMGLNTLAFSALYSIALKPFPFDPDRRLVVLSAGVRDGNRIGVSWQDLKRVADLPVVKSLGAFHSARMGIGPDSEDVLPVLVMDARTQALLKPELVIGRALGTQDEAVSSEYVLLISESLWRTRFGADPMILGRVIQVESKPVSVVGVIRPPLGFPGIKTDLFLPLRNDQVGLREGQAFLYGLGLLQDHASAQVVQAQLSSVKAEAPALGAAAPRDFQFMPLLSTLYGDYESALWTLQASAVLLVALAATNVVLLIGLDSRRLMLQQALEAALGAPRYRLARRLVLEYSVVAFAAAGSAIAVAMIGVRLANITGLPDVPRAQDVALDPTSLTYTFISAALVCCVVAGAVTFAVARQSIASILQQKPSSATRGHRLARHAALALQLGTSAILVLVTISAGLAFYRSARFQWGFNPVGVMVIEVVSPRESARLTYAGARERVDAAVSALKKLRGVEKVSVALNTPIKWHKYRTSDIRVNGRVVTLTGVASRWVVGAEYFDALGIPIVSGREFSSADSQPGAAPTIVISQALAKRLWPDGGALGRSIELVSSRRDSNGMVLPEIIDRRKRGDPTLGNDASAWVSEGEREIVGVVNDVNMFGPSVENPLEYPAVYLDVRQAAEPGAQHNFIVRSQGKDGEKLASEIRQVLMRELPGVKLQAVYSLKELADQTAGVRGNDGVFVGVSLVFALLAVVLAATGVVSVVAESIEMRRREIAVRLACGAQISTIRSGFRRAYGRLWFATIAMSVPTYLLVVSITQWAVVSAAKVDLVPLLVTVTVLTSAYWLALESACRQLARVDVVQELRAD